MTRVRVEVKPDDVRELELWPAQRLYAMGYKAGLDALGFGDCGGQCVCASCHVRVKTGVFAPMKSDEQELLDTLPQVWPDSRLSCQLQVGEQKDSDGLIEVLWVG